MAGKKAAGENTRKVAGNARKAEAAQNKAAVETDKKAAIEDEDWGKGAKSNAKKEAEAAKKAEQARKKAEKDALLAEEEKDARAAPKNSKVAIKKAGRGLDLSRLDDNTPKSSASLNATGIDNALDALSLATGADSTKIDKHPERRFKSAYAAFEERRLKEMDEDGSGQGLRQNQKKDKVRKEFEKSDENPFNQVRAAYDASKGDIKQLKEQEMAKIEQRLGKD
ncbi:putative coiled-coil domain-containing protein like protein [Calycina marina]|uniref:Coiled-coil domain-containing protein like protein n=1 Tax=Calycina marina TaxID=1763456 RepID=A0A9P7Z032_9HELO|nr:putative coiled-coil domain-containing protein like protein [Calycina marina]